MTLVYPGMLKRAVIVPVLLAVACLALAFCGCVSMPAGREVCETRKRPGRPLECLRFYCRDSSGRYAACPDNAARAMERYRCFQGLP